MFFKKKIAGIPVEVKEEHSPLVKILIRLGTLEAEITTLHDKIDKLEVRTRKDKTQRPQETSEDTKKGVFLRPDGSLINYYTQK